MINNQAINVSVLLLRIKQERINVINYVINPRM